MAGECPGWYVLFLQVAKSGDAYGEIAGDGLATTNAVTATAAGGVGPYTYAWALVSGSPTLTRSGGTTATSTWSYSATAPSDVTNVWRCTVTDAALTTATVDVTVQIVHSL